MKICVKPSLCFTLFGNAMIYTNSVSVIQPMHSYQHKAVLRVQVNKISMKLFFVSNPFLPYLIIVGAAPDNFLSTEVES